MATRPQRFKPEKVIEALEQSGGIMAGAALLLKCDPVTIRNYIKRYPKVQKALLQIEETNLDVAETALMNAIRSNTAASHMTAVIFYLKTKGKHRGYIERQELAGAGAGPDGAAAPPIAILMPAMRDE